MARILVIEDNAANLELMTYLLTTFGHTVANATEGAAGIASARRERPDLVVCDVQLPHIDGYDIARCLKRDPDLARIPLLAVTAFAMVGDRDQAMAAGFDGYIAKPIDPERFVGQVESLLRNRQHGQVAGS